MKDIVRHHLKCFEELPEDIREKGITFLSSLLSDEDKKYIREDFEKDSDTWWAISHFNWGMRIRNRLRDNVCLDNKLPSGNWDDYYVILVEKACGLR